MSALASTPKLNVADGFWNTCVHAGTTTTFRVLSGETHEPVDASAFLLALASRIHRLDASLKELRSDVSGADATAAEHDEEVRQAAEVVYKSLEVEVSLLDDPAAVPEDPSLDAAVDLWLPMHLAVVVNHEAAIRAILAFHQDHALSVIHRLAGGVLGVEEYAPTSGVGTVGNSVNAMRASLTSIHTTASATATGADDDTLASGEQTPSNRTSNTHEPAAMRSSASPEDKRLNASDGGRAVPRTRQRPVVELQVRPEMGQALVLLGHYVLTPASAAAAAPGPAATRTTKPTASPTRQGSPGGANSHAAAHASSTGSQPSIPSSGRADSRGKHADPTAETTSEEEAAAEWLNLNLEQMQREETLFDDAGDALCLSNVLSALKSLIRLAATPEEASSDGGAVATAASEGVRRVSELIDPEVLGHLYVGSSVLYDACRGDLNRLETVLTAFQGTLTPVLRGKSLPYSVSSKSIVQQRSSVATAVAGRGGATADTPTMRPISRTSSGMLAETLGTPRGRASLNATTAGLASTYSGSGGVGLSAPQPLPPGVHASSAPFWLHCAPQEAQRLAFNGLWIAYREQYAEGSGSARMHRHMSIRQDYRMAMAGLKKARLPNLSRYRAASGNANATTTLATVVPTASSIVSSGQLFLISRLVSSECRLEEFLDLTEDSSLFNSLAPASFTASATNTAGGVNVASGAAGTASTSATSAGVSHSTTGICGVLPLVLAASAYVAAELRSPSQIRLVINKMEIMVSDTRNNALKTYVSGRPATHADRFEELWLSEGEDSPPKKFKTRAEMLFYSTIERVLVGAERSWAEESAIFNANQGAAGDKAEAKRRFHDRLTSMGKALQSWVVLWRNFLITVRDRPALPGGTHRRSFSSVSRTSATATPKMQPMAIPSVSPPPMDILNAATATTAFAPDPVVAVTAAVAAGANLAAAGEEDETTEATEMAQRLLDALPLRMQHGEPPLPEIGALLFPPSLPPTEDPATVSELPQTTLDSEFEYSQHAFSEMAGSEPNDVKLKFYGLFKQATVGDINVAKPWLMDQVGRAKWEAWNKLKGMNAMDAKRMYVSEFKLLKHMRSTAASSSKK